MGLRGQVGAQQQEHLTLPRVNSTIPGLGCCAQVAMLGDELGRANQDRAAAQGAVERLSRQLAEGQAAMAMDSRRQMEEQVCG